MHPTSTPLLIFMIGQNFVGEAKFLSCVLKLEWQWWKPNWTVKLAVGSLVVRCVWLSLIACVWQRSMKNKITGSWCASLVLNISLWVFSFSHLWLPKSKQKYFKKKKKTIECQLQSYKWIEKKKKKLLVWTPYTPLYVWGPGHHYTYGNVFV